MGISLEEVQKLAELSRIDLSEEEMETMRGEIDSILSYIDTIQKVDLPDMPEGSVYFEETNVMREDTDPHEPGMYTQKLLAQAARTDGDLLKVKKIIGER